MVREVWYVSKTSGDGGGENVDIDIKCRKKIDTLVLSRAHQHFRLRGLRVTQGTRWSARNNATR